MKANYTPPKGVTQLTYNVGLKEITRLKALDERSKVISEYPFQAVVKVKCGKQSDSNYKKWDYDTKPTTYILNFNHKGTHVYMQLKSMARIYSLNSGLYYKILAFIIKELPK